MHIMHVIGPSVTAVQEEREIECVLIGERNTLLVSD